MTEVDDSDAQPAAGRSPRDAWYWARLAVGVGLLVALVYIVGPLEMLRLARDISPGWALAIVAMALVWLCLGALNVWVLLRRVSDVPFSAFSAIYLTSWAMSLVLPGQLGDAAQVVMLRRHRVNMSTSAAAYVVDKSISLGWMVAVATYGIGLYLPQVSRWWLILSAVAAVGLGVLAVAGLHRLRAREGGLVHRGQRFVHHMTEQIWSLRGHGGDVALNVGLTIVKWCVMAGLYLAAFRAFGASVAVEPAATIPVMSSLIGYIPITVGGTGTTEWTAVTLFAGVGVGSSLVVSVYLLLRAILVACAFALLLSFRWARSRRGRL